MGKNILLSRSVGLKSLFNGCKIFGSKTFGTVKHNYCADDQSADKKLVYKEVLKGPKMIGGVVTEMKNLSPNVKWLNLMVDDKDLTFKAGQWVDLHKTGIEAVGGYSITCPPSHLRKTSCIELAVKYSQFPPTYWIHTKCRPTDQVSLRLGGEFYFDPNVGVASDDVLLIAGGVGINPLYSMLCHVRDLNNYSSGPYRGKIRLLCCARTLTDLIWKKNIEKISQDHLNIDHTFFTSREDRVPPGIKSGRIKLKDIMHAVKDLRRDNIQTYICGPPAMMEEMVKHCYASGITMDKISFEKWTAW